jgi:hypothetical protein
MAYETGLFYMCNQAIEHQGAPLEALQPQDVQKRASQDVGFWCLYILEGGSLAL